MSTQIKIAPMFRYEAVAANAAYGMSKCEPDETFYLICTDNVFFVDNEYPDLGDNEELIYTFKNGEVIL